MKPIFFARHVHRPSICFWRLRQCHWQSGTGSQAQWLPCRYPGPLARLLHTRRSPTWVASSCSLSRQTTPRPGGPAYYYPAWHLNLDGSASAAGFGWMVHPRRDGHTLPSVQSPAGTGTGMLGPTCQCTEAAFARG